MKVPLTHIRFLYRARDQFGGKVGVADGEESWTYRQYAARCHQLAHLLKSWSIRPGARVAFLSYNTHHLLEAYYGVPLAGGVLLPLNIRLAPEDFSFILNDCAADCLFFHPDFTPVVDQIRPALETVRKFVLIEAGAQPPGVEAGVYDRLLEKHDPEFDIDVMGVDEDAVAELFYTSGTTDRPKGVMLTHRNLYLHALEAGIAVGSQDYDVQLHTIPLFHVNGWGTPQFLTCVGGLHVMLKKFDPAAVFEQIERHRVTTFSLVPTMATALVNFSGLGRFDVSSVRKVLLGGAAANARLVREVEAAFNCECVAGYGLTETSPVLTLSLPKKHLARSGEKQYELKAMTGYAIPGVDLKIIDPEGQELPWDGQSIGEIAVQGDMVMEGYWRRPEETREAMRDGWFHTGDMATIDPDGYVLIVDRKKDIIVSGGENISSLEVEKAVLAHPAVLECAVIPVPDPTWGEAPKALVVLKADHHLSEEELIAHCRRCVAGFKVPCSADFLESLPKGGTGKILKRELRERYWAGQAKRVH